MAVRQDVQNSWAHSGGPVSYANTHSGLRRHTTSSQLDSRCGGKTLAMQIGWPVVKYSPHPLSKDQLGTQYVQGTQGSL